MTVAAHIGGISLLDDARAVLLADLGAALAEATGGVADFDVATPRDLQLRAADGRRPSQGAEGVALAVTALGPPEENTAAGVRFERWEVLARCTHRRQRYTTDPSTGAPLEGTQEHEAWRYAHGLARGVELALTRGLPAKPGVVRVYSRGALPLAPDPAAPGDFALDLRLDVVLEAYDATSTTAP